MYKQWMWTFFEKTIKFVCERQHISYVLGTLSCRKFYKKISLIGAIFQNIYIYIIIMKVSFAPNKKKKKHHNLHLYPTTNFVKPNIFVAFYLFCWHYHVLWMECSRHVIQLLSICVALLLSWHICHMYSAIILVWPLANIFEPKRTQCSIRQI